MKVKSYKELQVWQKGIEIVDKVYSMTEAFPREELYGLTSQMRRASVSIPTNVAEGFVRHHTKEYIQFLHVALGSCAELETLLVIAARRKYVTSSNLDELSEAIDHETRMLVRLIQTLNTNHVSRITNHEKRGAFLIAMALISAVTGGIAAWSVLFVATAQARQAGLFRERTDARYLAEAGLVIARERLWASPAYCGGTESVDINGDGTGDVNVAVTVTNCGAGNPHQVTVQAVY